MSDGFVDDDGQSSPAVKDNGNHASVETTDDITSETAVVQETSSGAASLSAETASNFLYPKVCRNHAQFKAWQKTRAWLDVCVETGNVKCLQCSQVKRLGLHNEQGQHNEVAFVDGTVTAKTAKCLLKKIDKHRDSHAHAKCIEIVEMREADRINEAAQTANAKYVQKNQQRIDATARVFRTAYECVKSHLPLSEHPRLLQLQSLNGLECGKMLYSHHACSNIVSHIAGSMRGEVVQHIVESKAKFSVLIDESTSVSNVQSLIVYIRTLYAGEVCTYFMGLLPLAGATAEGIESTLLGFFDEVGLTDDVLKEQFIGFCSDGASCMIGVHRGVSTLLKQKYPSLQTFHCMAHRLELAVKDAVDTVNPISHFRVFVDELYKVFSMSPKNQRELQSVAESLSVELLKIQRVFDVRWVFSSFLAVKAVLHNYCALFKHFKACSMDGHKTSKERSKYAGLAKKLQNWLFVSEACMVKDALRCLKLFSLYVQRNDANVIDITSHLEVLKDKLLAMKQEDGRALAKFLCSFRDGSCYKTVEVNKKDSDDAQFEKVRCQFFQALHDNIVQRFPCTDLLNAARCLNLCSLPVDPLQRALFGESDIALLCKTFGCDGADAADTVLQYSVWKKHDGRSMGQKLRKLVDLLKVLPVSSAECERGFSQMNLHHTSGRNRLLVSSVNNLLMVSVNGPPIHAFNAEKYVISWLKSGKHSAMDKPTGLSKTEVDVSHGSTLFT